MLRLYLLSWCRKWIVACGVPPQACNSDFPTFMTSPYGLACVTITLKAEVGVLKLVKWMARSSAKAWILAVGSRERVVFKILTRGSMYRAKRDGLRGQPCLRPRNCKRGASLWPFTRGVSKGCLYKHLIMAINSRGKPAFSSSLKRVEWTTKLKVLERSRYKVELSWRFPSPGIKHKRRGGG